MGMKYFWVIVILLCVTFGLSTLANEINLYTGIDGWRHDTGVDSTANPGWSIGVEYLFDIKKDSFYLGSGIEYKSKVKGLDKNQSYGDKKDAPEDYSLFLAYIKGKLHFCCYGFYMHGRIGYSYNDNGSYPADNGPYVSAGIGYDFTRIFLELAYELFDINDNDQSFNDGTMQIVSGKIGYKF